MKLLPVTLPGRAVRLEPLAEAHHAALERNGAEAEIWRWMTFPSAEPRAMARAWCAKLGAMQARGEAVAFAIVDTARGEAVGGTVLFDHAEEHKRVEIGYTWLARTAWRTAINTEAKFLLLRHAFETLGLNRVQLKTDARNARSQAAIARLGAVREGVWRSHMILPDGWVRDSVVFSILAAEWPAVKSKLERLMDR
ncbi:MAG: GNAT family N-acetyltransferase [Opitutaceae bacterium]|nr:GNAT family N-acetyltransferase [Opitutaceae bacterium]